MKKTIFILLFVLTFFAASILLQGQEKRSRIGIGISMGKEITSSNGSVLTLFDFPSIYVPIIISSKFRLEPGIGFYRYSDSGTDWEESTTILSLSFGIFVVTRKDKVDIYYGVRNGLICIWDYDRYDWNGTERYERSKTDYYFGPAMGGEYFFSKHFSLGGEVQLNYVFIGQWDGGDGGGTEGGIRTKTFIFVRWYF